MALHHIRLDQANPMATLSAQEMPRLEFRQALFRSPTAEWRERLRRAALMVTTVAHGLDGERLVVDHQAMRFGLLFNASWPEPRFPNIRVWPYKAVELREDAPVISWTVEMRLRDLRLRPDEWVELAFLG